MINVYTREKNKRITPSEAKQLSRIYDDPDEVDYDSALEIEDIVWNDGESAARSGESIQSNPFSKMEEIGEVLVVGMST